MEALAEQMRRASDDYQRSLKNLAAVDPTDDRYALALQWTASASKRLIELGRESEQARRYGKRVGAMTRSG